MKDTCDVGAIKEGIEALKKQIEKDEPKKECTAASGNISLLFFLVIICGKFITQ